MKRMALLAFAAVILGAGGVFLWRQRMAIPTTATTDVTEPNRLALLGKTGRPQLVEFFNPG
jgi:hypothetical protein